MKANKKYNEVKAEELIEESLDTIESVEEIVEEIEVFKEKDGVVSGCTSLYVRSAAHTNASPIDTIAEGTKVKIIGEDGDFWKIESPEGFSMKKFIKEI